MSNDTDGGPAFPLETRAFHHGMSLRDYFAGQALAGMCAAIGTERGAEKVKDIAEDLGCDTSEVLGRMSFAFADAMLAARTQEASHE